MEPITALFGMLILLITLLPFILSHFNRVKKESNLLKGIHLFAEQNNCNISSYEICNDFIIGIDESQNQLFFLKESLPEHGKTSIDLNHFKTCKTSRKTKTIDTKQGSSTVTEELNLCFTDDSKIKQQINLLLFGERMNLHLNGELQFAEKWEKRLNRA
jgi:hypothetical protein